MPQSPTVAVAFLTKLAGFPAIVCPGCAVHLSAAPLETPPRPLDRAELQYAATLIDTRCAVCRTITEPRADQP